MRSFILMGPPRAGSTLLAHVINHHPRILCTDEHRIFLAGARSISPLWSRESAELNFRERFRASSRWMIIQYYQGLGATDGMWWGDKFPHYCDPGWPQARDSQILEGIESMFPEMRYIYLSREREATIRSMTAVNAVMGWYDEPAEMYDRIERCGQEWEERVGSERFLRVTYEEGLESSTRKIREFFGLPDSQELAAKIKKEHREPTRYSAPTSW